MNGFPAIAAAAVVLALLRLLRPDAALKAIAGPDDIGMVGAREVALIVAQVRH